MSCSLKIDKRTVPLNLPSDWIAELDSLALDLGTNRNAVLCMAIRLGGPILRANHSAMTVLIRRVTSGHPIPRVALIKILGVAQDPPLRVKPKAHAR